MLERYTNKYVDLNEIYMYYDLCFMKYDQLYFDGYNKKWGRDGLHEAIEWSEYEVCLLKFYLNKNGAQHAHQCSERCSHNFAMDNWFCRNT